MQTPHAPLSQTPLAQSVPWQQAAGLHCPPQHFHPAGHWSSLVQDWQSPERHTSPAGHSSESQQAAAEQAPLQQLSPAPHSESD